jgi:2-oxoisovalerate dehydrogenase E1 component
MDKRDHEFLDDLRLAHLSRAIDDREIILSKHGKQAFQVPSAGHEALLVAIARFLRPGSDWLFPYYRDRALLLALGMTPLEMLLHSVGAGDDPSSGGRQLPSHWASKRLNMPPLSSPTGSQCLPAVGCAEASRYIAKHPDLELHAEVDEITLCCLGDGTTAEGEFWESLGTASALRLPILYVIADNGYSHSVRTDQTVAAPISVMASGFPGLHIADIDGTDYFAARKAAAELIGYVRAGLGPALIRATVPRPYSHSSSDSQSKYRERADLEREQQRDPLVRMENELIEMGLVTREECDDMRTNAVRIVAEAAEQALTRVRPAAAGVLEHVVVPPDVTEHLSLRESDDEPIHILTATAKVLHEIMETTPSARIFGEDVADAADDVLPFVDGKGGAFGVTKGLQREFGSDRCYNTSVAEAAIVGRAIGQAYRGLRPMPEVQFLDFIWPAMQQIRSEGATIRWRSNGTFTCPMVMRVPVGGYAGGGSGIWHSQCGESFFSHIPGLLIAFPSTVADTVGLMRTAMQSEDPVLFFEHKHLLRQNFAKAPYPADGYMIPFGKARTVSEGTQLTIVTYGATVEMCRVVAAQLAESNASIEIIDLRTIAPWDQEAVAASVRKTSRLLIVHEDTLTSGFGAEIASWSSENLFDYLDAPVTRVGALDAHVPSDGDLEYAFLPQVEDIRAAAEKVLDY